VNGTPVFRGEHCVCSCVHLSRVMASLWVMERDALLNPLAEYLAQPRCLTATDLCFWYQVKGISLHPDKNKLRIFVCPSNKTPVSGILAVHVFSRHPSIRENECDWRDYCRGFERGANPQVGSQHEGYKCDGDSCDPPIGRFRKSREYYGRGDEHRDPKERFADRVIVNRPPQIRFRVLDFQRKF
jgi:hypothetical protein